MFIRIITTFTFIFVLFFAQHTYAQVVPNATTPPGDLIYQHTFETDPEWITDQPQNFYWDESEGALFVRTHNKNEDYTPNRYFYTETNLDPTKSFTLSWDFMPVNQQPYSLISFGLYTDQLAMKGTSQVMSGSTLNLLYGNVGVSKMHGFYIIPEGGSNHGGYGYAPYVSLNDDMWYTVTITYDATAGTAFRIVTERNTGEEVWITANNTWPMFGDVFAATMKNLGIGMYPIGHESDNGQAKHHPDSHFEAYIDNVTLFGSFDEDYLPTLATPTLHHPLDTTTIPDGATVTHNTVTASGVITDPQGEAVQLELELKKTNESLDGTNAMISSTTTPSVTIEELIPKDEQYEQGGNTETFHYRMRARTEDGRTSAWTEPQTFTAKVVPLFTQVESEYPSDDATFGWFNKTFAGGKGDYVIYDTDGSVKEKGCGRTFAQCACAITSLTMLGHYYNIRTGVDGAELNPFNLDAWLLAHESYTPKGGVWWSSALAYMGIQETNGDYASRLKHEGVGIVERDLIDSYITSNNPVIAYSETEHHFLVLDSKLADTYTVRDPNWYQTKTLNETTEVLELVNAYDNKFESAHLFGFHDTPQVLPAYIQAQLASPAHLVIIAPDGNRLGFDPITNIQYNEITEATYYLEGNIGDPQSTDTPSHYAKNIAVPNPLEGAYTLKVIGTDTGSYTLSTRITDSALNGTSTTHVKDTAIGHTDTYQLTFDPEGEGFTVKTVDELLTELRSTVHSTPTASFMTAVTMRSKIDTAYTLYSFGETQETIKALKELKSFVKDNTGQDITPAQSEAIVTEIKAILVLLKA